MGMEMTRRSWWEAVWAAIVAAIAGKAVVGTNKLAVAGWVSEQVPGLSGRVGGRIHIRLVCHRGVQAGKTMATMEEIRQIMVANPSSTVMLIINSAELSNLSPNAARREVRSTFYDEAMIDQAETDMFEHRQLGLMRDQWMEQQKRELGNV